jgi:hypothetical protein
MAQIVPALPVVDVARGIASLDADIPRVLAFLGKSTIEELSWRRPNKSSLIIPLQGTFNGVTEQYLLRLGFSAYRRWPPSAQFVNPETLAYTHPMDQHHLPMLSSPECHVHPNYGSANGKTLQLICCSATQEFYDAAHTVESDLMWREQNTFYTTIAAIQKAMVMHYGGRFAKV